MSLENLKIFTGNAHAELARGICDYLGIALGQAEVFEFSNENIFVRILEHVRGQDVFVVQPTCSPVHRSLWELLIMIEALKRASAGRITAVVPYFAYARTDKKDQPRVPITARLIADCIEVAGANRILTLDLHAGQIMGFFRIPGDELTALYILYDYFRELDIPNVVVVGADTGIAKRARNFAERLNAPLAIIEKRRVGNDAKVEALNVIGDVDGRNVLIFDDEADTAGSLCEAALAVQRRGARHIYATVTHAVLSGPAIERLERSPIKRLVVTDTIPIPPHKRIPKLEVLSVSALLGEAVRRIHTGSSVGALYEALAW